jgi:hypothetical protein
MRPADPSPRVPQRRIAEVTDEVGAAPPLPRAASA